MSKKEEAAGEESQKESGAVAEDVPQIGRSRRRDTVIIDIPRLRGQDPEPSLSEKKKGGMD